MTFEFGNLSGLRGRKVYGKFDRFSYVPHSRDGHPEYIFGFRKRIPTADEEPDVYRDAVVNSPSPGEAILSYPHTDEIVLLLTTEEDDNFRRENQDVVSQVELFKMDI